ncbi:uncharacterized protein LOC131154090 [Malania oleifera]|uniref:uncharacterized protein LOC131154090 n=1 Tax=Malania oleifera TaxID=397392 RepID=UPI0025ADD46D|nr:uncharacterized protein LOC131154090 [Malania oleifera]
MKTKEGMLQTQSKSKKDTDPPLFFTHKPPASFKLYQKMLYEASTAVSFPEKMAAAAPVKIGTRGTVGSLVMKEIEYFSKLELEHRASCSRVPRPVDVGSSSGHSRPSFWSLTMTWKRKKRRGSGSGFLPNICSAVEVAESHRLNGVPGFNYRILKSDENNLNT